MHEDKTFRVMVFSLEAEPATGRVIVKGESRGTGEIEFALPMNQSPKIGDDLWVTVSPFEPEPEAD